jgi:outer membrane phospholipase A
MNIAYAEPILTISDQPSGLFGTLSVKFFDYITSVPDNPDIAYYRGYSDVRLVVGQHDGLQLSTLGRIGSGFHRGSAQFDLTYPLTKLFHGNVDLCVDAQYFLGYGDGLLDYNQRSSIFRMGFCLIR